MGPPPSGVRLLLSLSARGSRSKAAIHCRGAERTAPVELSAAAKLCARWRGAWGCPFVLVAKDHAALFEIVRRHLDGDPISRQRLDPVLLHATGRVGDDFVSIVELHPEAGIRQNFSHQTFELDQFFLGHARLLLVPAQDAAKHDPGPSMSIAPLAGRGPQYDTHCAVLPHAS